MEGKDGFFMAYVKLFHTWDRNKKTRTVKASALLQHYRSFLCSADATLWRLKCCVLSFCTHKKKNRLEIEDLSLYIN